MVSLSLNRDKVRPLHILCLGAHCDDIEIGCGGTVLQLTRSIPGVIVHWIVFSSNTERRREAVASAEAFLASANDHAIAVHGFRDGFFPYIGGEIKDVFELLKQRIAPDIIFTHYRRDLHQDHRVISELTWNTFRNHLILEYEIPKYDGDLGSPNAFVHLDQVTCDQKIDWLMTYFGTQNNKHWFSPETFRSIMRLRGIESRAPAGYAEAYYAHKVVLG